MRSTASSSSGCAGRSTDQLRVAAGREGLEGRPGVGLQDLHGPIDVLTEYEDLATKQNDNNGGDLDKFHGITTFKRVEIRYANKLDADTDAPVYGVNHAHFYPIVLVGRLDAESDPFVDRDQHNTITTFIDCSTSSS
jgi:hypothetical protein